MNMWQILKSQRGNFVTVSFLILLPLLLMFCIQSLEHSRLVYGSDLDLQQAVNDATRSAAMSVDPLSQAYNDPMINPDQAHMVFKHVLAQNLGLGEDLTPTDQSGIESIQYVFFVVNGSNNYSLPEGVKYSSIDPLGSSFNETLPGEFTVLSGDIIEGEGEGIRTSLNKPGCIGMVIADLKPMYKAESQGARWAAAKILK